MTITIPDDLAEQAHLSPGELRIDLAAYLYERGRLTMGQARRLAGLDLIAFQHELANRDIVIQLGVDDFEKDMDNMVKRNLDNSSLINHFGKASEYVWNEDIYTGEGHLS